MSSTKQLARYAVGTPEESTIFMDFNDPGGAGAVCQIEQFRCTNLTSKAIGYILRRIVADIVLSEIQGVFAPSGNEQVVEMPGPGIGQWQITRVDTANHFTGLSYATFYPAEQP